MDPAAHQQLPYFRCRECRERFATIVGLKDHISSSHLRWKPYSCAYCKSYKSSKAAAEAHLKDKHRENEPKIITFLDEEKKNERDLALMLADCHSGGDSGSKSASPNSSGAAFLHRVPPPTCQLPTPAFGIFPPVVPGPGRPCLPSSSEFDPTGNNQNPSEQDDRMKCLDCMLAVKTTPSLLIEHLFIHHIGEKTLLCPYCSYGDKTLAYNVKKHIETQHPGEKVRVLNIQWKFRDQIMSLAKKCFPWKDVDWTKVPRLINSSADIEYGPDDTMAYFATITSRGASCSAITSEEVLGDQPSAKIIKRSPSDPGDDDIF